MEKNYFIDTLPSEKISLLDDLIGSKVTKMTRYSWWNKEESAIKCEINNKDVFSLTTGPIEIGFNSNILLGISSDVKRSSVVLWVEKYGKNKCDDLMEEDSDLFPIQADDSKFSIDFFKSILGKTFIKYEIIKRETNNPLQWDHPREAGLVLFFSNGSQLILAHQLSKEVSDDFTVLKWEQVDKEIYKSLYKMSRFW